MRPSIKRQAKRIRRLRRKSTSGSERCWNELQQKVSALKGWGYLSEDGTFNIGAKVLMSLQIQEVFITELVLHGVLEDLEISELFGVLCGMCAELPRGVTVPSARAHRALGRKIGKIRSSDIVVDAEQLSRLQVTWDHQMIPIGQWWAEGRSMEEIMLNVHSPADVSGSLVGAFRRAKDLASQLREVWREAVPERAEQLRDLIRSVSRDEVEVVG